MTIEERIKLLIGDQVFQILALQIEVEKLRGQVAEFEKRQSPPEPLHVVGDKE
jgi:hypothetical protein